MMTVGACRLTLHCPSCDDVEGPHDFMNMQGALAYLYDVTDRNVVCRVCGIINPDWMIEQYTIMGWLVVRMS